jgi:hypothetical protein
VIGGSSSAWMLSEPFVYKIDRLAMDSVIDVLSRFKKTEIVEEGSFDKSKYGLKDPSISLDITFENGSKIVNVGDQSFDNTSRYAEMDNNGDIVYMSKELLDPLIQSMSVIVDKHFLNINSIELSKIYTQFEEKDNIFEKQDDVWGSTIIEGEIDSTKVNDLINNLLNIRADSMTKVDEDFDDTVFEKPIYLFGVIVGDTDYQIKAVRKEGSGEMLNVKVYSNKEKTDLLTTEDFLFEIGENKFEVLFAEEEEYLLDEVVQE